MHTLTRAVTALLAVFAIAASLLAQDPKPYGSGTPGTNGKVPVLTTGGVFRPGNENFTLTVSNGKPGARVRTFFSIGPANYKIGGTTILIDLNNINPLPVVTLDSKGSHTYKLPVPDRRPMIGKKVYAQAFIEDAGGSFIGLSATRGLEATVKSYAVQLPIEVIGAQGTIRSVDFDLSDRSSARTIWLQVNNLSYDEKASVRLNGGGWIDLENANKAIKIAEPENSYGGIGGGFKTIRLSVGVQVADFKNGTNTLSLRFNKTDKRSIGFRVIRMNVQDSTGADLLPPTDFANEDPSTWKAPLTKATDILAGSDLWHGKSKKLKQHYLTGASTILARCADCHADNGLDLKYFNFSNHSIIERSKFHGLTEKEGEQVASYIRSLNFKVPSDARPWNPPYQPGSGTDSKQAWQWAAGAGLDAVLASDKEMSQYMFGTGSDIEIAQVLDVTGKLNLREMPIAVQFPDWNSWLPEVHPLDIWGTKHFEAGRAHKGYLATQATLAKGVTRDKLVATFSDFQTEVTYYLRPGFEGTGAGWIVEWGTTPTLEARDKTYSVEYSKLSLASWSSVKQWELVQTHGLSDKTPGPDAEKYQWPSIKFNVFLLAPHFIGDRRSLSRFVWQRRIVGTYMSSIWYQVQAVLTPGMKIGNAIEPVDWTYNHQHVLLLGELSGHYEPARYFQNLIKCYQQRNVGNAGLHGWTMREVSPWRVYSNYKGVQTTQNQLNTYTRDGNLRVRVTNAMLREFLAVSEKIPAKDWHRNTKIEEGPQSWHTLEPATYAPILDPNKNVLDHKNLFARDGDFSAVEADAMARLLDGRLQTVGVDCGLLKRLAAWSEQFWPKHDWIVKCQ